MAAGSVDIAHLVHLTDLHLLVTPDGRQQPVNDQYRSLKALLRIARLARWAPSAVDAFFAGLDSLRLHTLRALERTLSNVVPALGRNVVVVQSGDVEAYGVNLLSTNGQRLPGFDYLANRRGHASLRHVQAFVDLYGNHDVWPGTFPPLVSTLFNAVRAEVARRAEFDMPIPDRVTVRGRLCDVDIYRVNSVHPSLASTTLANGMVSPHLPTGTMYPVSAGEDPIAEIQAIAASDETGRKVVRVLVMHHPPHFFTRGWWPTRTVGYVCGGRVANAPALCAALAACRFHLVLAGHRHEVHPERGRRVPAQRPLTPPTIQLVAGSPASRESATERPSFSVYTLRVDGAAEKLSVSRVVYDLQAGADSTFTPREPETLSEGMDIT